jgi:hypothetical protein
MEPYGDLQPAGSGPARFTTIQRKERTKFSGANAVSGTAVPADIDTPPRSALNVANRVKVFAASSSLAPSPEQKIR